MKRLILCAFACIVLVGCASMFGVRSERPNNEDDVYRSVVKISLKAEIPKRVHHRVEQVGVMVSGTAWPIDSDHLITAGHVCAAFSDLYIQGFARDLSIDWLDKDFNLQERVVNNLSIAFVDEQNDLCMLNLTGHGFKPLRLARSMKFGESVWMVGAPLGILGFMMPGRVVNAHMDLDEDLLDKLVISSATTHGDSGGVVVNSDGEVMGVLVNGTPDFEHLSIATGLDKLRIFVDQLKPSK